MALSQLLRRGRSFAVRTIDSVGSLSTPRKLAEDFHTLPYSAALMCRSLRSVGSLSTPRKLAEDFHTLPYSAALMCRSLRSVWTSPSKLPSRPHTLFRPFVSLAVSRPLAKPLDEELCAAYSVAVPGIIEFVCRLSSLDDKGEEVVRYGRFTGFLVGKGYIASTAHGFGQSDSDGKWKLGKATIISVGKKSCKFEVKPIGVNLSTDVAVVELPPELVGMEDDGVFPLGGETQVGSSVISFGHPLMNRYSPRFGRVVCEKRSYKEFPVDVPNRAFVPEDFSTIVIDSNDPGGFSGGPVINTSGEVISIVSSIFVLDKSYVTATVPISYLRDLIAWVENKKSAGLPGIFVNGDGAE